MAATFFLCSSKQSIGEKQKPLNDVSSLTLFQETAWMKLGFAAETSEMDRFRRGKEESSMKKSCIKRET